MKVPLILLSLAAFAAGGESLGPALTEAVVKVENGHREVYDPTSDMDENANQRGNLRSHHHHRYSHHYHPRISDDQFNDPSRSEYILGSKTADTKQLRSEPSLSSIPNERSNTTTSRSEDGSTTLVLAILVLLQSTVIAYLLYQRDKSKTVPATTESVSTKSTNHEAFDSVVETTESRDETIYKDSNEVTSGLQPLMWSRANNAEAAKTKRAETSDVLHKLRKANTTAPQKKGEGGAEPWKVVRPHTFLVPTFEKTAVERSLIQKALGRNLFFDHLSTAQLGTFVKAFEHVEIQNGKTIMKQDDPVDFFYVLVVGQARVEVDGKPVHKYGPGTCFGEWELLHVSNRHASVIAESEITAFRMDERSFHFMMKRTMRDVNKKKLELLKEIDILKDFEAQDLQRLCDSMVDRKFGKDEEMISKEQETGAFYIVMSGRLKATDSSKGNDVELKRGDYFGDEALTMNTSPSANLIGVEDGWCLGIDKSTFEKVLGTFASLTAKSKDKESKHRASYLTETAGGTFSEAFYQQRNAIREFYKDMNTPIEDLNREEQLGEGQFGSVWLVKVGSGENKQDFALKIQDLEQASKTEDLALIRREIKTISSMQHPFIVDLLDSKETEHNSYMLMSLCRGGELWEVIHKVSEDGSWESGVKEEDAKFYSYIVADVIAYMHRQNVLFRDLKPENVLIDSDGYPNVIDFGFAKVTTEKTFTLCGTPNYMAPEIILVSGHGVGVDHWALGIMIYEMISGEHPFYYEGLDNGSLFELVTKTEPYPCIGASWEAKKLMGDLLEKDPTQRIGALADQEDDILNHAWFEDLDLDKLRAKQLPAPWIPPSS